MKCVFPSVTTGSSLTSVGLHWVFVQFGDDVLLHTRDLEHTVVPPPVFRGDGWNLQVSARLEGPVMVGEDLSEVHVLMKLLPVFPPEHHDTVGVETCSVAADWRGGRLLEERNPGKLWGGKRKMGWVLWVFIMYCTLIISFLFDQFILH